jgi:DNA-3-methyladenine glycosylase
LSINKSLHGWDVTTGQQLWLEAAPAVPDDAIVTGSRIGIDYAHPTDRNAPWRFWVKGNRYVSK